MTDPELMAVTTGVASTLIAEMVRGGAVRARAALVGVFRRAPQQQEGALLALARGDADALAQALAVYAGQDSEALARLRAMAAVDPAIQVQRNEGSGTFIGGDVIGNVTINGG